MAVNVKMGVDLSGFNSGIREGQNILKGLNAEMKATEAEFKATGNSEQMLTNKTKTLNSQLQVQKGIADQAKQALAQLDAAGVKPTDAAYQKLYATLMNAQAGMNEAQAALNALDGSQQQAAKSADGLATSVNSIGKKISLDQVISGINSIESGLERAAQKAVQLGETIWNNVMDSAKWADDTDTQALMFGIDVDTFQRMQKLVVNGLDTTVDAMLTAQSKLKKGIGSENKQVMQYMQELGLTFETGKGAMSFVTEDSVDLFFRAGQAIMKMGDAYDKEAAAQALFGKGWKELVPLFDTENGGFASVEEYNQALKGVQVNSEEDVKALADLNDKVGELKGNFETLSNEVWAQMAPALTDAATALNGLLESVLEYLETPEGKEMLKSLGDSVSELFSGMKNINAEDVVNGFKDAFDKVMDVLNWIVENKSTVVTALEGIFGFWATLKVSEGVGTILKVINGLKDLVGAGGGAAGGAGAATSTGIMASLKAGVSNVAKVLPFAAPFLLGIDGILSDQQKLGEWTENGVKAMADYNSKSAMYQGQDMYSIWDTLTRYSFATGTGPEDQDKLIEFAHHYVDWMNDTVADPMLHALTEQMSQEGFDNFDDIMTRIVNGEHFYSNEDLAALSKAIDDAINAAEEIMKPAVNVDVKVPDDSAAQITQQVGTVLINGRIVANGITEESFANGIHSVPYDGMLARLHKGERVVPAREVQSRSYNSNLYVESMYMNNGTDAAGLAAAMAAAQRRTMSGFGS